MGFAPEAAGNAAIKKTANSLFGGMNKGSSFSIEDAFKQFGDQRDLANKANKDRMKQILGILHNQQTGFGARFGQALGELNTQGEQARKDVRRSAAEERGSNLQRLLATGLASTTVLSSLDNRTNERAGREMSRISEDVGRQRSGLLERQGVGEAGLLGGEASFLERINEVGPSNDLYSRLFSMFGQGQGNANAVPFEGLFKGSSR